MNEKNQQNKQEKSTIVTRQFGERLKQARIKLGLNVQQASDKIGIEKNSYYKYEDGTRFPKPETLLSIMDKFQLNMNYLLSGEGKMFIHAEKAEESNNKMDLQMLFPGLDPVTFPLVEDLQVPIMKHALMMHYLVEKNKYENFIDEYFKQKKKKYPVLEENNKCNG
ncbi:MAG: helix-turn-helix transcriptional regulator [Candidatus Aminicenantes bacterium]|nr:MAG: helix-turn-helix transcriptional regulator [Candidatus Aminicenantes bacterium]